MGTGDASKRKRECGKKEGQGARGDEGGGGVMGRRKGQVMGEEGEEVVGRRRKRDRGCEAEEGEVLRGKDKG